MRKLGLLLFLISIQCDAQWTFVDIPTKASFRALKSYQDELWVSGSGGTVGHSKDAGKTWEFQQVPHAETLDFRDLSIINTQQILLMSAGPSEEGKAIVFKTEDGGNNWNRLIQIKEPGYFFDCIQWDSKNQFAWLLSDPIDTKLTLFTIQDKLLKRQDALSSPSLQPKEAFFAASGSSMLKLKDKLILVGGGADSARIYTYNINKKTWVTNNPGVPTGEAKGYFSVGAKNDQEIWAVGGDYRKLNERSIPIITTGDGGKHWIKLLNTPAFYMEKVIWAKPYWIVTGPSQSAAYHEKTKRWRILGNSPFHNIIQVGNTIWGIGAKGQLGYISLSTIDQLFLSKE
ncbi:YCF48-related protein [Aquirufa sp.]|jgi:hypothetical protein|uniref:YCF48-related protein n=1 Tax=Aquirufa sp. TaxID=2676249 RepID=UPI0037BF0873